MDKKKLKRAAILGMVFGAAIVARPSIASAGDVQSSPSCFYSDYYDEWSCVYYAPISGGGMMVQQYWEDAAVCVVVDKNGNSQDCAS